MSETKAKYNCNDDKCLSIAIECCEEISDIRKTCKSRKEKAYSPDQFQNLFKEFTEKENTILSWKAEEYSDGVDRLQNFREIAGFMGQRLEEVALLYLLKHIQSISLAVRSGSYTWAWETDGGEGLKQRIADARNYLLLLAACLDEAESYCQQSEASCQDEASCQQNDETATRLLDRQAKAVGRTFFRREFEKEMKAIGAVEIPMVTLEEIEKRGPSQKWE